MNDLRYEWRDRPRVGNVPGGLERRCLDCGEEVWAGDGGLLCGCGRSLEDDAPAELFVGLDRR